MTPFTYLRPANVEEAVAMKASAGPGARYLAGGTGLYDLMKLNVERPAALVDLTGLTELQSFDTRSSGEMRFGALSRMSDVAEDPVIRQEYPVLAEALWKAASQQLRNMASLGGNLLQRARCPYFRNTDYPCNKREPGSGCSALEGINRSHAVLATSNECIATYPGDWAVALTALDANVDVVGSAGRRTIPIRSMYRGAASPFQETMLSADEMIVQIRVPKAFPGRASTYHKIRDRESYAFALASAAVVLRMDGQRVVDARIALGGVSSVPLRAAAAEEFLKRKVLNESTARQAAQLAFEGATPRSHNAFKIPLGIATVTDALLIARRKVRT
jgi:xanthine dehydrogenase YagS FAD-binding subunit